MENNVYEIAILKAEEKVFLNDKGDKIPYLNCFVEIGNEKFSLYPTQKNKELFKYLIKQEIKG